MPTRSYLSINTPPLSAPGAGTHPSRTRRWTVAAVSALPLLTALGTSVAAPGDVFTSGPAPVAYQPSAPPTRDEEQAVSPTGEATHRVPFAVPPNRNGATPDIALVYGSRSPLRGGVAAGWSLPVPMIAVDTTSGRLGKLRYQANGQRLQSVDEPGVAEGVAAYRMPGDTSYARFEQVSDGSEAGYWIVRRLDGSVEYYGTSANSKDTRTQGSPTGESGSPYGGQGRWFLSRSVDATGNEIVYSYEQVEGHKPGGGGLTTFVDLALTSIEYGKNIHAPGTEHHARIELAYAPELETCPGSAIPVGAQFTYRTGIRRYEGARKLLAIRAQVRTKVSAPWKVRRELALTYDINAASCAANHAPLRMLVAVQLRAWNEADELTTLPLQTFEYGPREYEFEPAPSLSAGNFGAGNHMRDRTRGGGLPVTTRALVDLDGDGVPEALEASMEVDGCHVGGQLRPGLPWTSPTGPNTGLDLRDKEDCSVFSQVVHRTTDRGEHTCGWPVEFNHYRYLDMTGDGLPDLVSQIVHEKGQYRPANDPALEDQYPPCSELPPPPCRSADTEDGDPMPLACLFDRTQFVHPKGVTLGDMTLNIEEEPVPVDSASLEPDPWLDIEETPPQLPQECPDGGCRNTETCTDTEMICDDCSTIFCRDHLWSVPSGAADFYGWTGGASNGLAGDPTQQSKPPPPEADPNCAQVADMHCGHYVLRLHRNLGDGTFAPTPEVRFSPVPLETARLTGRADSGALANASAYHAMIDMDGDGHLDAVWQTPHTAPHSPLEPQTHGDFLVWRGDAEGNFASEPFVWPTPPLPLEAFVRSTITKSMSRLSLTKSGVQEQGGSVGNHHVETIQVSSLEDVNGDGLPDLVVSTPTDKTGDGDARSLRAYYNTGACFESNPTELGIDVESWSHTVQVPVEVHEAWGGGMKRGYTVSTRRAVDIDGDGLTDVAQMAAPTANQYYPTGVVLDDSVTSHYNLGDRLVPKSMSSQARQRWRASLMNITATHVTGAQGRKWHVATDVTDMDGDGLPEVQDHAGQCPFQNDPTTYDYSWCGVDVPAWRARRLPYRLLESIDNGFGAITQFEYASVRDASVVTTDAAHRVQPPLWVVRAHRVLSAAAPAAETLYSYAGPVTNEDRSWRTGFRGFEEVTVVGPASSTGARKTTIQRYGYDADPRGLPFETLTLDGSGRLVSLVQHGHVETKLFGSRVWAFHPADERSYVCTPASDALAALEAACLAEGKLQRHETTWRAVLESDAGGGGSTFDPGNIGQVACAVSPWTSCGGEGGAGGFGQEATPDLTEGVVAYAATDLRRTHVTGGLAAADRVDRTTLALGYDESHYLLLPTENERVAIVTTGTFDGAKMMSRQATTYDPDGRGLPTESRTWITTVAIAVTKREFDLAGNVVKVKRPNQVALGAAGKWRTTEYDERLLRPIADVNELGHRVEYERDLGTGAVTEARGPQQGALEPFVKTNVDGLGRVIQRSRAVENTAGGYDDVIVYRAIFNDTFAGHGVTEEARIKYAEDSWITTVSKLDAFGRVVEEQRPAGAVTEITTRHFDAAGNVREVTVPNPAGALPPYVSFKTEHDALGRITRDAAPERAPRVITYAGLTHTITELPTDGSAPMSKTLIHDIFGRLAVVIEGQTTAAMTIYGYDQSDRMLTILDADGVLTEIRHTIGGQRQSVKRAGNALAYVYDYNGNRVTAYHPTQSGVIDTVDHASTWTYDALDRLATATPAKRALTAAEQDRYDAGATVYTYDEATHSNGVGRLTSVTLPFGSITYDYTVEGWIEEETRDLEVAPDGVALAHQATLEQRYNALGAATHVVYPDHPTQPTIARFLLDSRGRPERAEIKNGLAWTNVAQFTRTQAGRVRARYSYAHPSGVPSQTFYYDQLGRVTDHTIRARLPPSTSTVTVAGEILAYDQVGNVTSVTDRATSRVLEYGYDDLHQLTSAAAANGQDYVAQLAYSPAGKVTGASVQSSLATAQVLDRQATYDFSPTSANDKADPAAVRALRDEVGDEIASFAYDVSGNLRERSAEGKTASFVYDGNDHLREAKVVPGNRAEVYWYDHAGERLLTYEAPIGGEPARLRHRFHGTEAFVTTSGVEKTTVDVVLGGHPVARVTDHDTSAPELLFHGVLGSLLAVIDVNRNVTARYGYGPYGEILYADGVSAVDYDHSYGGKARDELTGLSYYGARYYDPMTLSWTQADPLYRFAPDLAWTEPRRMGLYTFVLNNPLRYVDPDGLDGDDSFWDDVGVGKDFLGFLGFALGESKTPWVSATGKAIGKVTLGYNVIKYSAKLGVILNGWLGWEEDNQHRNQVMATAVHEAVRSAMFPVDGTSPGKNIEIKDEAAQELVDEYKSAHHDIMALLFQNQAVVGTHAELTRLLIRKQIELRIAQAKRRAEAIHENPDNYCARRADGTCGPVQGAKKVVMEHPQETPDESQ